ncbi:UDP-N-acetylmuramoyl-L-alanine--D-glutamate ligase [Halomonas sp. Bachu 37]|uniref:UDP-N-acetylmuramoyl-L-alanine--D-glutamate ligase n=1 Tax=Halomonas kashgarensis TaxID=3084920 RepID=UPI0032167793
MSKVPKGFTLVIGLGISGRAICRHLQREGVPYMVADSRVSPPGLEDFQTAHPGVTVHCGPFLELDLTDAEEVVMSPGVDPMTPGLDSLAGEINPATGEPRLVGEITLFVRAAKAPIAAITGSNAKSTVTTLLGEMAHASGINAAVGGNLGTPALDLLVQVPGAELFILELSSFQLETTSWLGAASVAFLNLCEDHLDRHGDMTAYRDAKAAIFRGARHAVVNADDPLTWPQPDLACQEMFTLREPGEREWGVARDANGRQWLQHGKEPWLAVERLKMPGRHNQANAMAALAMGNALGFKRDAMLKVLEEFAGLAHRSEVIAHIAGVTWINDSKGTNVGATLAAIEGIGANLDGKLILLAGGVGKGADFQPLVEPLARCARQVLVFGQDAPRLFDVLSPRIRVSQVDDMAQAMQAAYELARPGDCVLLSPACASLDQFPNYQARGDAFRRWVLEAGAAVTARQEAR